MISGRVIEVSEGEGKEDKGFWTIEVLDKFGNRYRYEHLAETAVEVDDEVGESTQFGLAQRSSPVCIRVGVYLAGSDTPIDFRTLLSKRDHP